MAQRPPDRTSKEREVQVCLFCREDTKKGFVRSVFARDVSLVPELKLKLSELKDKSREMEKTYVLDELDLLRARYAASSRKRKTEVPQEEAAAVAVQKAKVRRSAPIGEGEPMKVTSKIQGVQASKPRSLVKKLAGRQRALALKSQGRGLFAQRRLSPCLADVVGQEQMSYTEVMSAVWSYIKSRKLKKGKFVHPDEKLRVVCPQESFVYHSLPAMLKPHISSAPDGAGGSRRCEG